MLVAPSFNIEKPLRRAQSTASARTHRSETSIHGFTDDITINEQAIIAAMTAFNKTNGKHSSRATPEHSDLQRHRSQRNRNSEGEGSHFQASHVYRRRSAKSFSLDYTDNTKAERVRRSAIGLAFSTPSQDLFCGRNEATPSGTDTTPSHGQDPSLTFRRIRKSRSLYGTSSHKYETFIDDMSFRAQPTPDLVQPPDVTLQCISEMESSANLTTNALISENNATYQVDPDISKARDRHLQQFHKQRIRHRPSFMLSSIRKRHDKNEAQCIGSFDNVVTYDNVHTSTTPPALAAQRKSSQESYSTSVSIKERIRRVFRKSNISPGLPVQQAEASRPHFGDTLTDSSRAQNYFQPPMGSYTTRTQTITPMQCANDSVLQGSQSLRAPSPTHSEITVNTTKSRVTSWADSTITTTAVNRCSNPLGNIQEHAAGDWGLLNGENGEPSGSANIFRRMTRKPSHRGDVVSLVHRDTEDDNVGTRALPASSRQPSAANVASGSAHDTLPSQRRVRSLLSSRPSQFFRSTVRAVTPDIRVFHTSKPKIALTPKYHLTPTTSKSDLPSTVSKATQRSKTSLSFTTTSSIPRIRNRLRKPPSNTTKPTAEQIASRVERTNDRWKSPLEESNKSLFLQHSPRDGEAVRALFWPALIDSPVENMKTTNSAHADDCGPATRVEGISPSLYSRETDDESTPIVSCVYGSVNESKVSLPTRRNDEVGNVGVATSQPIGNYQMGSSQQSHPPPASADRSLCPSKDAANTRTGPRENVAANNNITIKLEDQSWHMQEHGPILNGEDEDITASSPDEKPVQIQTPRISVEERPLSRLRREHTREYARPISHMNDRFPMIETGRPSSRTQRKPTPPIDRLHSKSRFSLIQTTKNNTKVDENSSIKNSPRQSQYPEMFEIKSTTNLNNKTANRNTSSLAQHTESAPSTSISPKILGTQSTAKILGKARLTSYKSTPQICLPPAYSFESVPPAALCTEKSLTPILPSTNRTEFVNGDQTMINIYKGPYGRCDNRLASCSSLKENMSPLLLRSIGHSAGDGVVQGAATGEQSLAQRSLGERDLREESPKGSDGVGESLAFI